MKCINTTQCIFVTCNWLAFVGFLCFRTLSLLNNMECRAVSLHQLNFLFCYEAAVSVILCCVDICMRVNCLHGWPAGLAPPWEICSTGPGKTAAIAAIWFLCTRYTVGARLQFLVLSVDFIGAMLDFCVVVLIRKRASERERENYVRALRSNLIFGQSRPDDRGDWPLPCRVPPDQTLDSLTRQGRWLCMWLAGLDETIAHGVVLED